MPRQIATSVENNFRQGLITEASGLNFPENACTETYNCVFNYDGTVQRRKGFDFETNFSVKTIDKTNSVINTYLWKNVSGNGDVSVLVVQVGGTLYFYETTSDTISAGAQTTTVLLSTYKASGAPGVETQECQFSAGNGLLFVTHPYCDPFYISYDSSGHAATGNLITIKIRDLSGDTADANTVDNRPTATLAGLEAHHKYNLLNQGWNTTNLTAWDTSQTTMPSNVDVMWSFKNSSDAFDMSTLANVVNGNSPAPKGHFILTLSNQDRDTAAGTSGATATTTSYQRPSTSAFYAGRVFYSGINYTGQNTRIYFTQIIERAEQYGFCYQSNDPTSETLFDLGPSDGGYININDAGTIYKLVPIVGALLAFAANGVWMISGSTGLGFTATDYSISKISSTYSISASSFVDTGGFPIWWNLDGIYSVSAQSTAGGTQATVNNLTISSIKTFYDNIPPAAKTTAKGYFNRITGEVQWVYRQAMSTGPNNTYAYDSVLIYQTRTQSFYPWTVSNSTATINGVCVLDSPSGQLTVNNVVDHIPQNVVDGSGNQVIVFATLNASTDPVFVYLMSYPDSGSYKFTFGREFSETYNDWVTHSTPVDYTSYFISGYKLHGGAIRRFQNNYVKLYSLVDDDQKYYIQGLWDYATSGDTGRWSARQLISLVSGNYSHQTKKVKIRGTGYVLQFKVTNYVGMDFKITGWGTIESANAAA